MTNDWQPIETAPRDGVVLIFYMDNESPIYAVAEYSDRPGDARNPWFDGDGWHSPTHWMPLPAPPEGT